MNNELKQQLYLFSYFSVISVLCIIYGLFLSNSIDVQATQCNIPRGSVPYHHENHECYNSQFSSLRYITNDVYHIAIKKRSIYFLATSSSFYISFSAFIFFVVRNSSSFNQISNTKTKKTMFLFLIYSPFTITSLIQIWQGDGIYYSNFSRFFAQAAPMLVYMAINIDYLLRKNLAKSLRKKMLNFENTIFFPSFLFLSNSIMTGIVSANLGIDALRGDTYFKIMLIAFALIQISSIVLYYKYQIRRDHLLIYTPLAVIVLSLFFGAKFDVNEAKYIIAIYCTSYSLVIMESVLYYYFSATGGPSQEKRANKLYLPAINWAIPIFSVTVSFMPIIIFSMSYTPIFVYTATALCFWMFRDPGHRNTRYSLYFGLVASLACIVAHIASASGFFHNGYSSWMMSQSDTSDDNAAVWLAVVITNISTLGISLTIIRFMKDVLGLKLEAYFFNILRNGMFDKFVGSFMLLLVSSMVFSIICTLLTFICVNFSDQSASTYSIILRITFSALTTNIVAIISIIILWLVPGRLTQAIKESHEINQRSYLPPQAASVKVEKRLKERQLTMFRRF